LVWTKTAAAPCCDSLEAACAAGANANVPKATVAVPVVAITMSLRVMCRARSLLILCAISHIQSLIRKPLIPRLRSVSSSGLVLRLA
jgi:hypothetical protein